RASRRGVLADALPQVGDHIRGVVSQGAVEPGRVASLVAEFRQQPHRAAQGGSLGEKVGRSHRTTLRTGAEAAASRTFGAQPTPRYAGKRCLTSARCCCCAGAIPATRRAGAVKPMCSASVPSWLPPVSRSPCAQLVTPARPGGKSSTG